MEVSLFTYPLVNIDIPSPLSESAQFQVCPALDMYQNIFPYAYDVAIEQTYIGSAFRYLSTPVYSCLESDSTISRITKGVLGAFLYKSTGRYEGVSRGTRRAFLILSSWQLITSALAYTIPYIFTKELSPWLCRDYYNPPEKISFRLTYVEPMENENNLKGQNEKDLNKKINALISALHRIGDKYPGVRQFVADYEEQLDKKQITNFPVWLPKEEDKSRLDIGRLQKMEMRDRRNRLESEELSRRRITERVQELKRIWDNFISNFVYES